MKLNADQISALTEIDKPFLMLDDAIKVVPGESSYSKFSVRNKKWISEAHLASHDIFPGTIIIESMLQNSILILYTMEDFKEGKKAFVSRVNSKFIRECKSGMDLHIHSRLVSLKHGMAEIDSHVVFNDKTLTKGTFSYACPHLMPRMRQMK